MKPCMMIDRELFGTLPEWDVPALELAAGKTYFFSNGEEIVRYRDGSITRCKTELLPSYYLTPKPTPEDEAIPDGPIVTMPDGPVANAIDGTDVVAEELPEYEILKDLWDGLPWERRETGGYWRDDQYIYCQMIGQAKPTKMRVKFTDIPF